MNYIKEAQEELKKENTRQVIEYIKNQIRYRNSLYSQIDKLNEQINGIDKGIEEVNASGKVPNLPTSSASTIHSNSISAIRIGS